MRLPKPIHTRPPTRRTPAEPSPRQHNAHINQRSIHLRLMHMRNRALSVLRVRVEDIGYPFIHHELRVHGHLEAVDCAVGAEDLAEVGGGDVFR